MPATFLVMPGLLHCIGRYHVHFLEGSIQVYVDAVYMCSCTVQCTVCHKRLTSAGGLRVHCHQVHRFALEKCAPRSPERPSPAVICVRLLETFAGLPTCRIMLVQLLLCTIWCSHFTALMSPIPSNAGTYQSKLRALLRGRGKRQLHMAKTSYRYPGYAVCKLTLAYSGCPLQSRAEGPWMWRCLGWLVFQRGQFLELLHQKVNSMRLAALSCMVLAHLLVSDMASPASGIMLSARHILPQNKGRLQFDQQDVVCELLVDVPQHARHDTALLTNKAGVPK